VFAESPGRVLQELAEVAVSLCHADSAGVSLEAMDGDGRPVFHWVVTSGVYAKFLDAMLPRDWMPCQVTVETMRPQHVRVPQAHFAALGVDAAPITDGMLIPWTAEETRGTIWILAHGRTEAFDLVDYEVMQTFADFASMATRYRNQEKALIQQAGASAAAALAHELAHEINNPLQSITNSLYLASRMAPNEHVRQASDDLRNLSSIVRELLSVSHIFKQATAAKGLEETGWPGKAVAQDP
jgi:signal transduction histidine kinase